MSSDHNVFISHRHEDDGLVSSLKDLLAKNGAEVRDSSITSDNPNDAKNEDYIKSLLRDRIEWAGKIIVIVSPDTKNHEWVDWEIEYAKQFPDKRIIGVFAPGAEQSDLPTPLEEYADAVVPWDGDKIIDALNGADSWESPDGAPVLARTVPKAPC